MSPLVSYRRLLGLTGPLYVVVAFVGRLPAAMSQMGALLLVSSVTGSYAAGGLAAGSLAVANAVGSPVAGALADRLGQRPVVVVQSLLGGAGLLVLVALAHRGAATGVLVAAAGAAGLLIPQVGPLARVRWRPITRGTGAARSRLVDAAFSYEGAADEASYVLGPALLGVVVAIASPGTAVVVAAALLLAFGTWFGLHPTARLVDPDHAGAARGRLVTGTFAALFGAQLLVGVLFGSVQTGTSVLAEAQGQLGLAGLVHATLGIGSVLAGLAMVLLPDSFHPARRLLAFAVGMLVLSAPLLLVDGLGPLVAVVMVLGTVIAPYMITTFTLAERVAPRARVGAAMTLMAGATGIGYALGSSTAGRLADASGHTAAFAVSVSGAGLAVVLALVAQPALRRIERVADPVATPEPAVSPVA
ncbi:MAG: MFS transporter [Nocardioides sp.]|nr:MFS transporter [Nocardioides sp.]